MAGNPANVFGRNFIPSHVCLSYGSKYLIGQAQLGEYFRVFVSYGVVAVALVIYEWRRARERAYARRMFRGEA